MLKAGGLIQVDSSVDIDLRDISRYPRDVLEELALEGGRLRQERLDRGLSLMEIARRTNIRVEHLRRLEAGALEDLPDHAYARAFARAYAAELGLDPAAAIVSGGQAEPGPLNSSEHAARPEGVGAEDDRSLPAFEGSRLGVWASLAVLGSGALVAAILLAGGDPAPPARPDRDAKTERTRGRQGDRTGGGAPITPVQEFADPAPAREPAPAPGLRVSSQPGVSVCILADGKATAVDGKLVAGASESLKGKEFLLIFPFGFDPDDIDVTFAGERVRFVDTQGPSAAEITKAGGTRAEVVDPPAAACG
jgi:transcriptional regulator with XRE-family HTH domain